MDTDINQNDSDSYQLGYQFKALVESCLDFERWGFDVSLANYERRSATRIIYDSEWCRVKFFLSRKRYERYDELNVDYGRLHAPNHSATLFWQGKECLCWHSLWWKPIQFLDGLTPQEAVDQEGWPPVPQAFKNSAEGRQLEADYWPKFSLRLQSILWEHYGERLFGLFDLRQPDLWDEYRQFVEEYYRLTDYKPSKKNPFPPLYKI